MATKRKPKLGSGERFASLKRKLKKQYMDKGMSAEQAEKAAAATAAKVGRAKYGKKKYSKLSAKGRKGKS